MAVFYRPCSGDAGPDGRCLLCGHSLGTGWIVGAQHFFPEEVLIVESHPRVIIDETTGATAITVGPKPELV